MSHGPSRPRHSTRRGLAPAVPLLFLSACFSSSQLTISRLDGVDPVAYPSSIRYGDPWEALRNLDFDGLVDDGASAEQRRFAEALRFLVAGDRTRAMAVLRELAAAQDPVAREEATKLWRDLLRFESRWSELGAGAEAGSNARTLSEAFSGAPAETYQFPRDPVVVPMELSRAGNPIVEIEVNGRRRRFWIDTGAGLTALASDVAAECGVRPAGTSRGSASTSTVASVGFQPALVSELKLGGLTIRNHPAMILDRGDLTFKALGFITLVRIEGVLGWNALRHLDLELDYGRSRVTLREPARRAQTRPNLFWFGYPTVRAVAPDGTLLHFGFDTGASSSTVTGALLRKLALRGDGTSNRRVWGAGGQERSKVTVLRNFELVVDGHRLHFGEIKTGHGGGLTFVRSDGVLGSDIGRGRSLRLDFSNGRFELGPVQAAP